MVGFRRERNTASVPYRSNEMGVGFRDDVNYFNLDPITAGPQITSYLDFSNFVPSYVPPPPPPAPVYNPYNNDGDGGGDGPSPAAPAPAGYYGDSMNSNDQEGIGDQGPPGGSPASGGSTSMGSDSGMSGPGDMGSGLGGHASSGAPGHGGFDGGGWWNTGGTIPPMYANQGMIATNDPYDYSDEQRARQQAAHDAKTKAGMDAMIAREHKEMMEEALLGYVPEPVQKAYSGITNFFSNKAAPYTDFAKNPSINTANKAIESAITPATMVSYGLGLPPGIGPAALEGLYNGLSYLGSTYGDQAKADRALKAEINEITGGSIFNNPTAAAENAVGDYNIDDTDPNMGAIPGNYAPPSSNITTVSNPITGAPTYSGFVPSTYDDFMADVAAEIAAIDSEYQDFTDSYSNTDFDDDDGGGYDPDNAGHSPGSNANASDSNTGMGMGIGGGNDGFRSAGGHIYASQGGYVNSTGGK